METLLFCCELVIGLFIAYFLIKNAVKNGVKEALTSLKKEEIVLGMAIKTDNAAPKNEQ